MTQPAAPEDVLDFWFGQPGPAAEVAARQRALWFGKSAANDQQVTERFADTLIAAGAGKLDHWAITPRGQLALIVVLDQFPHHIHRNHGQSFAYDAQSLALAQAMIQNGDAERVAPIERVFVYLPLEHAESMAMQDESVALYAQLEADASCRRAPPVQGISRLRTATPRRRGAFRPLSAPQRITRTSQHGRRNRISQVARLTLLAVIYTRQLPASLE